MTASPEQLMSMGIDARLARLIGYTTYAGDPTNNITPEHIGQWCLDTTNNVFYVASTAATGGWAAIHS